MAALLVPLTFAGLARACSRWPTPHGIRESLLRGALVLGGVVLVATELLSLFDAISAPVVLGLWVALAGAAVAAAAPTRHRYSPEWAPVANEDRRFIPVLPALACATILGLTFLNAIAAAPNYPDSMTYHMGRIAHWIQERSVDWYPTADPRQNYQMPFAEFVILHLQLLSGGDRWANLVQWSAFALSGVTVSLILAELGQSGRVQWAGAILALTLPMAIVQASGAQNDLVVSLWLLLFLHYLWRTLGDRSLEGALLCGLALGLALATKGTAYLYAPAMAAALVAARGIVAQRERRLPPIPTTLVVLVLAACLSLGIWARSVSAYGAPVCCSNRYFVERLSPSGMFAGIVRNTAVHLGAPKLLDAVPRVVDFLAPPNDPGNMWPGERFVVYFSFHEGKAGNSLFLLLFLASAVTIVADRRLRRGPMVAWAAAAVAGFAAYSIALKWQPWASRLHTPCFLAASVPVAMALGAVNGRLARGVLALAVVGALPYLLVNQSRPLVPRFDPSVLTTPRADQYYADRRHYQVPYAEAAAFLREREEPEIGLLFDGDDYEYPFWLAIKNDFAGPPLIRHVGVSPMPGQERAPSPPAIVVSSRPGERHTIDGFEYIRLRDFGELSVLKRATR